jgi:hypothetical protein
VNTEDNTNKKIDKKLYLLWALLSILLVILFLQAMFHYTDGHLSVPNADYFMFFQYAKQLATGHPFEFNTGDPGTTGATSLLYTAVLALGYVFFKGIWLFYGFALPLALLLLICSIYLFFRIAHHFFGHSVAFFSSLLFLLSGPIVSNYFAGMDFALFSFLFWAAIYVFCFSIHHRRLILALLLVLLIYTRPEGSVLFFLFLVAEIFCHSGEIKHKQKLWPLSIPVVAIISLLLLNYKITGNFNYSSLSGKSIVNTYSFWTTGILSLSFIINYLKGILVGFFAVGRTVGLRSAALEGAYFPPFMFFFFIIGIGAIIKKEVRTTRFWLGVIIVFTVVMSIIISSLSNQSGVSHHRHSAWIYPGIILFAVVGLNRFSHIFEQTGRIIKQGFLIFWIIFAILSFCLFIDSFGKFSHSVYFRDILLSDWINKKLPSKARILTSVNASSFKYLTDRYVIDMLGINFNEFTGSTPKDINGRIIKYLQYCNDPPEYLLVRANSDLIPKEFVRSGFLLTKTNSFLPDEFLLYHINLKGMKDGLAPSTPRLINNIDRLSLSDAVDVGYLPNEQMHKYSSRIAIPETSFTFLTLRSQLNKQQIWDVGRLIMGEESFEIQVEPGQDLLWVARIKSSLTTTLIKGTKPSSYSFNIPFIEIKVLVDGEFVDKLSFSKEESDHWQEISYIVPGKYLKKPKTKISFYGRYGSFHHWFYQ